MAVAYKNWCAFKWRIPNIIPVIIAATFLLLNSNPDKAIPLIVISSVMAGVTPTTKIINHNGYALIWSKTKATSFV